MYIKRGKRNTGMKVGRGIKKVGNEELEDTRVKLEHAE